MAGVVALNQRGEARDAARVADAQRLGVEALGEDRLDQALLRTRTAVELDESPATLGNMLSVLLRNPAALGVIDYGWMVYGAAISPDGTLIATGDESGASTSTTPRAAAPRLGHTGSSRASSRTSASHRMDALSRSAIWTWPTPRGRSST